ncbi:cobalamin biosynthesis protein CobG [Sphingobium sufflavum]|uniref:cobalamin biosynthesis protein CobG n=1 Tax=Sphingobium sufflavum TaxID=1129547 RepID=UPI001F220627|nr:cobalamin biosynthesis protein CobG [Sphingobium sufflavum]MCE7797121.1 cobalamin biosynthesis protein CobG [Sphingobium sufflavum]
MTGFAVRGWCPTAWRPMLAGDGLIVRVRPRLGQLSRAQILGLCEIANVHGNGMIDATSRANLQIRGVAEGNLPTLLDRLVALDLVDADRWMEERRAILVAPDWTEGDDSARIAGQLTARLGDLPDLPAKVGFGIDAGDAPVLGAGLADFRIERGADGGPILRAEGRATGVPVAVDAAAEALVALAHWFVESGGVVAGRMARHAAPLPDWARGEVAPAPARAPLQPGRHALGVTCGVAFGSMAAGALATLVEDSGAQAVRLTPWRMLLLEGARALSPMPEGFIAEAGHPLLRADACPGAPLCPQATVATRPLALRLARHLQGRLHISGCAKGCAHAGPVDVVATGRDGLFDLGLGARAGDPPSLSGLTPQQLLAHFGAD